MDKITRNKVFMIIVMFTLLGSIFYYFLMLHPISFLSTLYWLKSFIFMLLFLYFIYVLSFILQMIIVVVWKVFPIQVWSLYPFTYDGKIRFHPILLTYNIEAYSNSLYYNLVLYLKNEDQLYMKLHQFLKIRKISICFAYSILFLSLPQKDIRTFIVFLVAGGCTILTSFFIYSDFWKGIDAIYKLGVNKVVEFLYSTKTIMFLSSYDYAKAFIQYDVEDPMVDLCLLENYLYRCIIEKKTVIKVEIMKQHQLLHKGGKQYLSYNLGYDVKRIYVMKLIGWAGIYCDNEAYIDCSIALLTTIYDDIVMQTSLMPMGINTLKSEIEFLASKPYGVKNELKLLNIQNIFSIYEKLKVDD